MEFLAVMVGGSQHIAVNLCKFGRKMTLKKYELHTFVAKIRDNEKKVFTFSVYINDKQNTKYQFYIHIL